MLQQIKQKQIKASYAVYELKSGVIKKPLPLSEHRLCCRSTFEPEAVGIVHAALVHRFFINNQAHVVVSTLDRGEAGRVSHLPPLHPAGHAQMHPQLSEKKNDNCGINGASQVPACTAEKYTSVLSV